MTDLTAFIQAQTRPLPVPSLPLIRLYQANEVTPLWLMTEQEMASQRLSPPFWAFAWSGGQALARHILENPEIVRGRRVLDIACGSGLVGIAASQAGAHSVLCNDIDPYAGAAVALNAALNGVDLAFTGHDLLASSLPEGPLPEVDVILAGDICYEKPMTDAMLTYFRRAARHRIETYIGDPHRTYFPTTGLIRLADYDILTNADIEETAVKPASVWKLET
ncbi:MAG: 50S ribosomal protein L11 methyltransferase [Asticcacaulis sp.]|uniref:class I SAM-dependent methyltransferase n=1 Tax=Asticcacaulis sp. TaxID=1872648 RepID=UPI0039E49BC4